MPMPGGIGGRAVLLGKDAASCDGCPVDDDAKALAAADLCQHLEHGVAVTKTQIQATGDLLFRIPAS